MAGPAGDWHRGTRRHLRVCREQTWAQCPAAPHWRAVPLVDDGFTLKAASTHFRPATAYGGWRRTVHVHHETIVRGGLGTLAWPEMTDLLLEMALERQAGQPHSYCMDYYTPADPRRCLGAMVDALEIRTPAGPPSPAGGDLTWRFELIAAVEEANATLAEDDFSYTGLSPVPFRFVGATLTLGGADVTGAESFALRIENNLAAGPNRGGSIAFLMAGTRAVRLELLKLDDGDAFNEAIRQGGAFAFSASFGHPDGHGLVLTLPSLVAEASAERARPDALARAALRMEAGTDGAGDDVTYTLNLSV